MPMNAAFCSILLVLNIFDSCYTIQVAAVSAAGLTGKAALQEQKEPCCLILLLGPTPSLCKHQKFKLEPQYTGMQTGLRAAERACIFFVVS